MTRPLIYRIFRPPIKTLSVLEHHTGVGGRFSVLTNVGMLPAMARGLDADAIRAGADLYGIDAFDQPAVELGKVLTREYLSRME